MYSRTLAEIPCPMRYGVRSRNCKVVSVDTIVSAAVLIKDLLRGRCLKRASLKVRGS